MQLHSLHSFNQNLRLLPLGLTNAACTTEIVVEIAVGLKCSGSFRSISSFGTDCVTWLTKVTTMGPHPLFSKPCFCLLLHQEPTEEGYTAPTKIQRTSMSDWWRQSSMHVLTNLSIAHPKGISCQAVDDWSVEIVPALNATCADAT